MDRIREFTGSNILITGGLGFIGSNLARTLVRARNNGHYWDHGQ